MEDNESNVETNNTQSFHSYQQTCGNKQSSRGYNVWVLL